MTQDVFPHQGITGQARLAGVIGWPIAHSRSPLLHNFWLRRYGIDGAYLPLAVQPGRLETAVRGLQAAGFRGVNVTIPHKEDAFALCDVHDRSALRAGSVNTLTFLPDGRIAGQSTDGHGFVENLRAHGVALRGRAMVLGAGGSARSVVAALLDLGMEVRVANRTAARAQALVGALGAGEVVAWDAWPACIGDCTLLVNTTSLGMHGGGAEDFAPDLSAAAPDLVVTDIVYVPRLTPLLAQARARGLATVDGFGMLLHQARPGFAAWFGRDPEVDAQVEQVAGVGLA